MSAEPYDVMTPTEELFLEVLAARHRLGESFWTFSSRTAIQAAANRLTTKSLIWIRAGQVERTFQAGLTEKGRAEVLATNYTPPIARQLLRPYAARLHALADEIAAAEAEK